MTTLDRINQVAAGDNVSGTTIYWDSQDPQNAGPAYRDGQESGSLELVGWGSSACDGYEIEHYFDGAGAYLGPDGDGVYPVFSM